MKKHKSMVLFFAMLLILAGVFGCSGTANVEIQEEAAPAGLPLAEIRYVLVDESASDVVKAAAEALTKELGGVSGFEFQVIQTRNPLLDFERGDVCYALLSGRKHAGWTRYAGSLGRAFLYTGYEHFTMSLNSKTVLGILERELDSKKITPLAAFYQGSDFLLSAINLDDYTSFQGDIVDGELEEEQADVPVIGLRDVSAARRDAYEKAGASVLVETDSALRLNRLLSGELQAAEFSFEGDSGIMLSRMDWDGMFFTRSWQNADPLWLVMDKGYEQGLTPSELARIKEAVAEMFPKIDQVYLEREDALSSRIADNGATVSRDFYRTRQRLDQNSPDSASNDPAEKKLLAYIRELGDLA